MRESDFIKIFQRLLNLTIGLLVTLLLLVVIFFVGQERPDLFIDDDPNEEVSIASIPVVGTDDSDFVEGDHRLLVVANCTGCHSGKLVTQNRATREGWRNMIRWMQETQNLRDLGTDEERILDYLTENYAPTEQGRRQSLVVEQWYELEDESKR